MSVRLAILLALCLPALPACDDKQDGDDDDGPVDEDGDGSPASEDCDDTNPNVYPGAPDAWYDGLDADCDDADDYDADGDGVRSADYGGADCDDSDAGISPTATETWYDGVDADCRGDDDDDADVDGFTAEAAGGTDCDDNDADVWPGAADLWYDGVDADCRDDSDYDADGDGQDSDAWGGQDCNDGDASAYTGATETWYDGLDADCLDDSDYDADGDGEDSDDHGGDDCHDDDPEAYPGADEQIDGKDTDCNGKADDYRVDDDYGGSSIQGAQEDCWFGWRLATADMDGDGYGDVAVVQLADQIETTASTGFVSIYDGSGLRAGPISSADSDFVVLTDAYSDSIEALTFVPDLDRDGQMEIALGAPRYMLYPLRQGAAAIFTASELAGGEPTFDEANRWFAGGAVDSRFGEALAFLDDIDGDGFDDLVVGAPASNGDVGAAYLFAGDEIASPGTWTALDATAGYTGSAASDDAVGSAFVSLGDLTGDGYGDFVVGAPGAESGAGAAYVLRGGAVPSGGDLPDNAWATITGDAAGDAAGSTLTVGDTDADGQDDLIIGAPMESTQAGQVHVISGSALASGSYELSDLAYVSFVGNTNFGNAGKALASGMDVDGDGADDIFIGGPGESSAASDAGTAWLVISGITGPRALANADASFEGCTFEDFAGIAVSLGDIDGDGKGDLLFGAPGEDTVSDEGFVYIAFSGY